MPLDGIDKGREVEEDPQIQGHDPLKQKRSRWACLGENDKWDPMTGDGQAMLTTYTPKEVTVFNLSLTVCLVVAYGPVSCKCIPKADLQRQLKMLPHRDRSSSNFLF